MGPKWSAHSGPEVVRPFGVPKALSNIRRLNESSLPKPVWVNSVRGSFSRQAFSFSVVICRASSQLISTQPGSTSRPFSGFVRLSGFFTRYGWYSPPRTDRPRGQSLPWFVGEFGSPLISTATPSTTFTCVPQMGLWQAGHVAGFHSSTGAACACSGASGENQGLAPAASAPSMAAAPATAAPLKNVRRVSVMTPAPPLRWRPQPDWRRRWNGRRECAGPPRTRRAPSDRTAPHRRPRARRGARRIGSLGRWPA